MDDYHAFRIVLASKPIINHSPLINQILFCYHYRLGSEPEQVLHRFNSLFKSNSAEIFEII